MAVQVQLILNHGSEPESLKELVFVGKSWNDNPFLYQQDVSEILEHLVAAYGETMKANGYEQVTENRNQ